MLSGQGAPDGLDALFEMLRPDPDPVLLGALTRRSWRRGAQFALQTFTAQLAYSRLRAAGLLDLAPVDVQQRLGRVHGWNTSRNHALLDQLRVVTAAMEAQGIRVLVLKGAHVAQLYADLGARGMSDLDLLVDRAQLQAAQSVLLGLGFGPPRGPVPAVLEGHHLPVFTHPLGFAVELHWSLSDGPTPPAWQAAVWDRAQPLPGFDALAMEPLDALFFAVRHLAVHHQFSTTNGLAGLADVAVLAPHIHWELDTIRRRALSWDLLPAMCVTSELASGRLGAPIPTGILEGLAVPGWEQAAEAALWTLLDVGGLGITRPRLLPVRPTLNPPPPTWGFHGDNAVGGLRHYVRTALLPAPDDLALEHRPLGRRPLLYLAYPLHWMKTAYAHTGLLRLARPASRAAHREAFLRRREVIIAFVGEKSAS